jgi:hypothetical protein
MKQGDEVTRAWGEWVSGMGEWHVFGGLTYDQRRTAYRPSDAGVRRDVLRWLGNSKGHPAEFIEAAVVSIEHHRNEWPHAHPLLRLRGGLGPRALAHLGQAWFRDHGYAKLERPQDQVAVASYAAKYLAKELGKGDVIFWPPRGPLTSHQPALSGG